MNPETPNAGQINSTPAQTTENTKKCKHMPMIIVLAILAVAGLGFGGFELWQNMQKQPENDEDAGDQGLNAYEIRDLRDKTFRLLGNRNGISHQSYDADGFVIYKDYMPVSQIVANNIDNATKVYATLETTVLGKQKTCDYKWSNDVKNDIDDAFSGQAHNISLGGSIECVSYEDINNDYYDLWGENMPKINSLKEQGQYGDFAYGSNLDAYYYHIIGGRGGVCTSYVIGKIAQIDKDQENAYVDINAGVLGICADAAGEFYSDIEESEQYKTVEHDKINLDNLGLTEDDYASFQPYRFVFKKNSQGIYSFSNVKKL